jgi:hypothetical protein
MVLTAFTDLTDGQIVLNWFRNLTWCDIGRKEFGPLSDSCCSVRPLDEPTPIAQLSQQGHPS